MKAPRRALHRFFGLFGRSRRDADLAAELESHLELHIADNIRAGMTPEEARRQALIRLGGIAQTQEAYRRQRGLPFLEWFIADVRFALRTLRKEMGFATVAVLTLALGIGSSTAVFTVANAVLLREVPYPGSDRIVLLWGSDGKGLNRGQVSHTDTEDVRRRNRVFTEVANYADWSPTLAGEGEPERLAATQVGDGFFNVIGIQPFLGRAFTPEENIDGRDRVVILSYHLWKTRFNSDPNILGKVVSLSSSPHVIVGVMPEHLEPLPSTLVAGGQLYRPIGENYDDTQRSGQHLRAIARLKTGITLEQANEDVNRIAAELRAEHPKDDFGLYFHVASLQADTASDLKPSLLILTYAVIALLLIACANVAGLLLARGTARQKEFAVRTALGASRSRIVRQGLTESFVLATLGGSLGIALAYAATRASIMLAPRMGSPLAHVAIDTKVLAFAAVAVLATTLLFGIVPALQATVTNLAESLKLGGQRMDSGAKAKRFHAFVVVSELALALTVLTIAALLVNGFLRLQRVNLGFEITDRLVMNVWIPFAKYGTPEKQIPFYENLLREVSTLPGVTSAAIVHNPPMGNYDGRGMLPEGRADVPENTPSPQAYFVSADYLKTMGIQLLRGRDFLPSDTEDSAPVALVSEGLAKQIFPGEDPIGKKIQMKSGKKIGDQYIWRTIVGVVADVRQLGPEGRPTVAFYLPYRQMSVSFMTLVVHTPQPRALVASIRQKVRALDPNIAVFAIATYEDMLGDALLIRRVAMLLIVVFSAVALFLSAVGLYGLMAYVVSRRMHEFGVRSALGAQPTDILRLVFVSGARLIAIGAAVGLICSFSATRVVQSLISGLGALQFRPLFISFAVLMLAATIANLLPARTAARVDPALPLRAE